MTIEARVSIRDVARPSVSIGFLIVLAGCVESEAQLQEPDRQWLAGDHHIHSQYSMIWDRNEEPPVPVLRSHGYYPIPHNAVMARHFGLDWMVSTDHGGRTHSKIDLEQAYPTLLIAREAVPDLLQFYGVELNPPGGPDHASIIVARSDDEAEQIYSVESQFDAADMGTRVPEARDGTVMLEALRFMQGFVQKPVVISNHPARNSTAEQLHLTGPTTLRNWNDTAPDIAVGMEGAPGHQAAGLIPENYPRPALARGNYGRLLTRGGFDAMTAELGGVWDSMLGEGRRWWITANSDSHHHWTEGGVDFWPGEYAKTYVFASRTYEDVLEGIRQGRVFVTTGDLISELDLTVESNGTTAMAGEALAVPPATDVLVSIRVRDPSAVNFSGDSPAVQRIDLIVGRIDPALIEAAGGINPSTEVVRRFTASDWARDGEYLVMSYRIDDFDESLYVRVRGTNTGELEPETDVLGEDPWQDLWFYSNPVFVYVDS